MEAERARASHLSLMELPGKCLARESESEESVYEGKEQETSTGTVRLESGKRFACM
jgi:hypothetical protein